MIHRHATALETVSVTVPPDALEAYEAALGRVCGTVGFFFDEDADPWTVEGVKDRGAGEAELVAALALAALSAACGACPRVDATAAEGWLERTPRGLPRATRGPALRHPRAPMSGVRSRRGG